MSTPIGQIFLVLIINAILSLIFVGIITYQVVNTIRYQLRKQKINMSWSSIVQIFSVYKSVVTDIMIEDAKKIIIKYCNRPSPAVSEILEKINHKIRPFRKQKFVVT